MKIKTISIRNFRRLEDVKIDFESDETVFVGPNNSGKTSATAVFRCFLDGKAFKIHDFSVSKVKDLEAFGEDGDAELIPAIEMDIWFSIDPNSITFGRAFSLLTRLSGEFDELGVRLRFAPVDAEKLRAEYNSAYPKQENGSRLKSICHYLGLERNLNRHFETTYYSLEKEADGPKSALLEKSEGKRLLQTLVRVDFVDAQRNIDDDEASRSNRLSAAFAAFYKKNLEQAEVTEDANKVIDENNDKLTEHYDKHFGGLMTVIKGLGVPSVNDRDLRIVSSLSPEVALQGSTDLLYIDTSKNHELPEAYNGLGFKNLVFMAIQISHFHLQWMRTEKNRPLCQIIFIEEPEVHLHAQVQQTFISNIWKILNAAAKESGNDELVPQITVTTHSAHILDAVDFAKVRYFRRCELAGEDPAKITTFNASKVHSLRDFQPAAVKVEGQETDEAGALNFLQRYMKLTHCDLFFADAAVLIEGTVEKLLLSKMIGKCAPGLQTKYLTTLEVGGAYAHRFAGLMKFLRIPYLVITDIDSVEPGGHHKVCRADEEGALTSNASLKEFLNVKSISDLIGINMDDKSHPIEDRSIAFQISVSVTQDEETVMMLGRTLEETFVYQNIQFFREKKLELGIDIPDELPDAYQKIFERVKSASFKKTEFALGVLASSEDWEVPKYIVEGLGWLDERLGGTPFPTGDVG